MAALETTVLTKLNNWSLIAVTGPDATDFLQNQLTNNVQSLKITQAGEISKAHQQHRFAGYCTAKGRLQASFWISRLDIQLESGEIVPEYRMLVSKDLATFISKRLTMFVLRSKVKIVDQTTAFKIYGLSHLNDTTALQQICSFESIQVAELPSVKINQADFHRHIICIPETSSFNIEELFAHKSPPNPPGIWDWLEVMSGIPRITEATVEQFVPQMVNMESLHGIDFKKGCYPGQEIVARSQYRGTIKRRLQIASVITTEIPKPSTEIFHSADPEQPCGMVVLSATDPNDFNHIDLQVECKLDALLQGQIHLDSPEGPTLNFNQLPYDLIEI